MSVIIEFLSMKALHKHTQTPQKTEKEIFVIRYDSFGLSVTTNLLGSVFAKKGDSLCQQISATHTDY